MALLGLRASRHVRPGGLVSIARGARARKRGAPAIDTRTKGADLEWRVEPDNRGDHFGQTHPPRDFPWSGSASLGVEQNSTAGNIPHHGFGPRQVSDVFSLPFLVVQPYGRDKARESTIISGHHKAAEAFAEIDCLSSEMARTGAPSNAIEFFVVDAERRIVPRPGTN